MLVSGSILSGKYSSKEALEIYNKTNIDFIHLDMMDGKFVEQKFLTLGDIKSLSKYTNIRFDVHLMVDNPDKYIDDLSMFNVEYIIFHYEAVKDCLNIIERIKNNGIKVGISIKPDTKIEDIMLLLPLVDQVLVMSVEPGKSGQVFMSSVIYKLEVLKHWRIENNYKYIISIDGGINNETFLLVKDYVDMVVSASYLLDGNTKEKILEFKA